MRIFFISLVESNVYKQSSMSRFYFKKVPKKNLILTVVDDSNLRVKSNKMFVKDLNVIKEACGVKDKRKTFDIPKDEWQTLMAFQDKYTIDNIPPHVQRVMRRVPRPTFDASKIPSDLYTTLFPYQREGVQKMFNVYNGRCLLADDMGLGKTRQAVCFVAHCLPSRVLIICPSYLRYHWTHELEHWLGLETQLVKKGSENLLAQACVVSYDMLDALNIKPGVFKTVVLDESHYVKSRKTKRTKAATPIVHAASAALLVTGTPALNRPIELFSQLFMLRPAYVKNYTTYATRYCDGKRTPHGFDDRGSSNAWELNWVLKKGFMVRRLKRDVLKQLPPKTRHTVWLKIKADKLRDVQDGFKQWHDLNITIYKLPSGSEAQRREMFERRKVISETWRATAAAKCDAVARWVVNALKEGRSFIFFGYHKITLDAVQEAVEDANFDYMRIDGSTPAKVRNANVEAFQSDANIRIAILSIAAAGTGLTLTRVSECVFGELYWVPGVMIQAEDRVHRISQENKVNVQYLLGADTLDSYVHPALCKKLSTLDSLVDQRSDRTFQGETTTTVEVEEEDDDEESLMSAISKLF